MEDYMKINWTKRIILTLIVLLVLAVLGFLVYDKFINDDTGFYEIEAKHLSDNKLREYYYNDAEFPNKFIEDTYMGYDAVYGSASTRKDAEVILYSRFKTGRMEISDLMHIYEDNEYYGYAVTGLYTPYSTEIEEEFNGKYLIAKQESYDMPNNQFTKLDKSIIKKMLNVEYYLALKETDAKIVNSYLRENKDTFTYIIYYIYPYAEDLTFDYIRESFNISKYTGNIISERNNEKIKESIPLK